MTDLKTIEINTNTRLCSFDITNMYTNIPKNEVINITKDILENNNEIGTKRQKETIHILGTLLEQNYFQIEQEYYEGWNFNNGNTAVETPCNGTK
jgi:hypothetical protein